jgi:hypothetical protein
MIKPESAVRSTFCGAAKIVRCETSSLRHRRNFACMQIEASGASVSVMLQGGARRAFLWFLCATSGRYREKTGALAFCT